MIHNDATAEIEVDPETYEVRAEGDFYLCPAEVLPMAQRYFLFYLSFRGAAMRQACSAPEWTAFYTFAYSPRHERNSKIVRRALSRPCLKASRRSAGVRNPLNLNG